MLVEASGETTGTIGGGRVEQVTTELARQVAAGKPAQRLTKHLARDLGMCCGGEMELFVEPLAPSQDALAQMLVAYDERTPCVLVTPLDGGGKRVEKRTPGKRQFSLDDSEFAEPIWPAERLILFGRGHVARALGPLAASVGFDVVLCDDGEVSHEPSSDAPDWAFACVDSFDVRDVQKKIGPLGVSDYVVILSRDHAIDQKVLETLIGNDALSYLGLIGSQAKAARFRRRLQAKDLYTPERWQRLHCPVGLDIGAETPQEIAVAVVAQLVRARTS